MFEVVDFVLALPLVALPAASAAGAVGVASGLNIAGSVIQGGAQREQNRIARSRAVLAERRETLRALRAGQITRANVQATAENQGAAESSAVLGGVQNVAARTQENLRDIRTQGQLNEREFRARNRAITANTLNNFAGFAGDLGTLAADPATERVLSNFLKS